MNSNYINAHYKTNRSPVSGVAVVIIDEINVIVKTRVIWKIYTEYDTICVVHIIII